MNLKNFIEEKFGVSEEQYLNALKLSPGSMGAVSGAISEILLKEHLESLGYEVLRIKEKPSGGNNAKSDDAKGDFYIRKIEISEEWYVIECKGLKTNSEFRGNKWCNKGSVYRYLKGIAFPKSNNHIYSQGYNRYLKAKETYENKEKNKGNAFAPFNWNINYPGPNNATLEGLWENEKELKEWVDSQDDSLFTEENYRNLEGVITNIETHKPSSRVSKLGIKQTAPLVSEFSILAVDLFFRTGKHEFVFMNPQKISHSPSSPEHLYQNYTIDVLVHGLKERPVIKYPWYDDIDKLIEETSPDPRELNESQLDSRGDMFTYDED